jgi:hypothetical protein
MSENNLSHESNSAHAQKPMIPYSLGIVLICIGATILIGQWLKIQWLSLSLLPLAGIYYLFDSLRGKRRISIFLAGLFIGTGIGSIIYFGLDNSVDFVVRLGYFTIAFGLGFGIVTILSIIIPGMKLYWSLIPLAVMLPLGIVLSLSSLMILDVVLYFCVGLGIELLIWGIISKKIGFLIPGCLLCTIGPGIYISWGTDLAGNALAKTGLMLATFAFGWGFISLFSRTTSGELIWWPLIPGGVLAVVGWGLYIGGDPGNAPVFIANTGSVGLIIFGIYLLLMRKSMH